MPASPTHASSACLEAFRRDGVLGGIRLLTENHCRDLAEHLRSSPPAPVDWCKGRAVSDRLIYDVATRPVALELVRSLLGPNIILWGAIVAEQPAGETHAWRADIETSLQSGDSVSIWMGLKNTHRASTLELITGSHRAGKPVQQVAAEHGLSREDVTAEMALSWAREAAPDARLARPALNNGEAVVFDGRIWHASFNRDPDQTRTALVLQYANADMAVRMPDFSQIEWPFQFRSRPRPPVIPICGRPNSHANRVVAPPRSRARPA